MEVLGRSSSSAVRKGSNPVFKTKRSKIQSERSSLNQQLNKEMRLRAGAENLYNATNNVKVKGTVALELSYLNSSLQLLKEKLSVLNSHITPYQNENSKTQNMAMISLGLKETKELDFTQALKDFILEHYSEDPDDFDDEIADLIDLRNSMRTPTRNADGISLLLEYYSQLYFIDYRFFPPDRNLPVHFHWYDSVTGIPSMQKSMSLEKASVLFNVGALHSQIGTRTDRAKISGIDDAIKAYENAAGAFNHVRQNFSHAPCTDLTHAFLAIMTKLMLAQAQECAFERALLSGFEIQLGKCISVAQQAAKVAEKYTLVHTAMTVPPVDESIPNSWISMTDVKSHHFKALAHYYTAVGLLDQVDIAEVDEVAKLLSSFYLKTDDDKAEDIPSPQDIAKRREDRKRLGRAHLDRAIFHHETAISAMKICKAFAKVDTLQSFLTFAHKRTLDKKSSLESDEDNFFDILDIPDIVPLSDMDTKPRPPVLTSVKVTDIFRKLGPLSIFSARQKFTAPRPIQLNAGSDAFGFTVSDDSPTKAYSVSQRARDAGLKEGDIITSINGDDVKWKTCAEVVDILDKHISSHRKNQDHKIENLIPNGTTSPPPITMKVVTLYGSEIPKTSGKMVSDASDICDSMFYSSQGISNDDAAMDMNKTMPVKRRTKTNDGTKSLSATRAKNRHSLGFFQGLKMRLKTTPNFSTPTDNPYASTSSLDKTPRSRYDDLLSMNFDSLAIPKANQRNSLAVTRSETFSTQNGPQVTRFTKTMDIGLY